MESVYVHGPDILDITPDVDTQAGTLVWINGRCGQVVTSLPAGQLGAARMEGVIRMAKPEGFSAPLSLAWLNTETRLLVGESLDPEEPLKFIGRVVSVTASQVDILLNAFTGSV